MNNYVSKGDYVTVTPASAVASGQGVLIGRLFGIAAYAVAAGGSLEILTHGVFDIAKDTSTFAEGDTVYWDNVNLVATSSQSTTPGANCEIGVAVLNAATGTNYPGGASGDATVRVRLNYTPGVANGLRIAHFIYNFGADGGAVGAIVPANSDVIPVNALVAGWAINSPTAVTSGGAATIALGTSAGSSVGSLLAATGKAGFTADAVLTGAPGFVPFKMSSAGQVQLTIAGAALTAGLIEGWVWYYVSNEN